MSENSNQFQELMAEIKYATSRVRNKKFTLGEYYKHMADFFDYIERPQDAEEHRIIAKKCELEKGKNGEI